MSMFFYEGVLPDYGLIREKGNYNSIGFLNYKELNYGLRIKVIEDKYAQHELIGLAYSESEFKKLLKRKEPPCIKQALALLP